MARRHPILSIVAIALTIVGLFHFAKSFQASPTLADVKQFDVTTQDTYRDIGESHVEEERLASAAEHSENSAPAAPLPGTDAHAQSPQIIADLAAGKPIMSKMPNQTIRAEVGRAGWKMLHTILAQYPEEPTQEDRDTLTTYLKLFSRVYPCQECAEHFQQLLKDHPPQTSSRQNAIMWGCQAHNVVNKRLGKEEYDCTFVFDQYDCGCGETTEEGAAQDKKDGSDSSANAAKKSYQLEKNG